MVPEGLPKEPQEAIKACKHANNAAHARGHQKKFNACKHARKHMAMATTRKLQHLQVGHRLPILQLVGSQQQHL